MNRSLVSELPQRPASLPKPIVLCPLMFERKALARAGLADPCELQCCGPGAAGINAWVNMAGKIEQPVILAGLAGGISAKAESCSAWVITEVIEVESGTRWQSDWPKRHHAPCATITSADRTVTTTAAKFDLHQRTGADLVDLESAAFARAASSAGWTWGIVRGVSDPLQSSLPPDIDRWVDSAGRTHAAFVARSLLRHPWHIAEVIRLGTRSNRAMLAVAVLLRALLSPSDAP